MSGRLEKLRVWVDGDVQQGSSGTQQQQQQYCDMEQVALPHKYDFQFILLFKLRNDIVLEFHSIFLIKFCK